MSKPLDGINATGVPAGAIRTIADLRRGGAVFTAEDDHETDRWVTAFCPSPEVIGASL